VLNRGLSDTEFDLFTQQRMYDELEKELALVDVEYFINLVSAQQFMHYSPAWQQGYINILSIFMTSYLRHRNYTALYSLINTEGMPPSFVKGLSRCLNKYPFGR
jgi:hypothetical protein